MRKVEKRYLKKKGRVEINREKRKKNVSFLFIIKSFIFFLCLREVVLQKLIQPL